MRVAQIKNGIAWWVFDPMKAYGLDEVPVFPPDEEGNPMVFIEVSNEVSEGDIYDIETGTFTKPVEDVVNL